MNTFRSPSVVAVVAASVSLLVAGCSGPTSSGSADRDTLIVAESQPPDTLDPQATSIANSRYAWELAYQCLLAVQPDGSIEPSLATNYTVSPDEKTYTFELPEDATFHSGEPVTADDVVYTFNRLKETGIPYAADRFASVASVTATSPTEVQFELDEPDTSFLLNIGDPTVVGCAILNEKTGTSANLANTMDGTGPYRQLKYVPNQSLTMERFEDYRGGAAKIENLEILYVKDQSTARANLTSGKVDVIFPDISSVNAMASNDKITVSEIVSARTVGLNINNASGPLAKFEVRKAIALAIDRQEIVDTAYQGAAVPSAWIPPVYPWAPEPSGLANHEQDVDQAKGLMAKAGHADGLSMELMYIAGYSPATDRTVSVLQSQLAEIGITIKLVPLETTPWIDTLSAGDYDLSWNAYAYFADPLQYLAPRAGRQGATPDSLTTLIDQLKSTSTDEYNDVIVQIEQEEAELVFPELRLIAEKSFIAVSDGVENVTVPFTLDRTFLTEVTFGE